MKSLLASSRRGTVLVLALALFAVGCGSSGDAATDLVSEAVDVAEVAETATDIGEDISDAGEAMVEDTEGGTTQVVDTGTPVDLFEWGLDAPTLIEGGDVLFTVVNTGNFNHELAIARGTDYESLPLLANGAVDEDALGDAFIGRTETFGGGETVEATFSLEPGEYVLYCNIAVGPNSHAANGQVQSVTVS